MKDAYLINGGASKGNKRVESDIRFYKNPHVKLLSKASYLHEHP